MFNEQRTSPRKPLKSRAIVVFEGAAPLLARTADVSGNGISLTHSAPVQPGLDCQLSFELYLDGKVCTIKTRSKALYCIFSNGEYKSGYQFLGLDLSAMTLLAKYLR